MNPPSRPGALPRRFPVGAKYVVEGRAGEAGVLQVSSRYVVLPTGRRINVSLIAAESARRNRRPSAARQGKARSAACLKKIVGRAGTNRRRDR